MAFAEAIRRASHGRTSKNAMTVAMVSPFFILKFPFLSWAFTVSFGNFFLVLQKFFGARIFAAELHELQGITYDCKTPALRRPESFLGTARAVSWVPVEDSLNPDFS